MYVERRIGLEVTKGHGEGVRKWRERYCEGVKRGWWRVLRASKYTDRL